MQEILYILAGLVLLIAGGNWLLKAAVNLSIRLGIPRMVVGVTIVSLATSAPELIVSLQAALDGFPDLALGNVVGSNIANLGLVLGVTLLMGSIDVRREFYTVYWPMMMLCTGLFTGFIYVDGRLTRFAGAVLIVLLFLFLAYLLKHQKSIVSDDGIPEATEPLMPGFKVVLFLVLGAVALWGGSELLIHGAVGLAKNLGVSDRVIGVTIVSVGTSIPELAASVIAILKKEKAISVGNLIGSNIFNICAVLGLTAVVTPIRVIDQHLLTHDIFWLLGISFLVLPMAFFPDRNRLSWRDGVVLLGVYAVFIYTTIS